MHRGYWSDSKNQLGLIENSVTGFTVPIVSGGLLIVDTFTFLKVPSSVSTIPFPCTNLDIVFSALYNLFTTLEKDGREISFDILTSAVSPDIASFIPASISIACVVCAVNCDKFSLNEFVLAIS